MENQTEIEKLIRQVRRFKQNMWHTPNTYDTNFARIPSAPGIYLLFAYKHLFPYAGSNGRLVRPSKGKVVYIGSSKNLRDRHKNHNIMPLARRDYEYVRVYFKEVQGDPYAIEVALIKAIRPKYNLQHTRG